MKRIKLTKRHRNLLLAGAGCLVLVGLFYFLARQGIGLSCLFHSLTGLQCPGCGNSRAVLALLRLDIVGALRHNLLFPLEFFYLGWVVLHCCKSYLAGRGFAYRPPWAWLDGSILAAVLLWWLLRNLV